MISGHDPDQGLGAWMLAQGMLTADQLQIARIEQQRTQYSLAQQLVRLQFVSDALMRDVLARHNAQQSIDLQQVIADHEALALIPEAFARQHRVVAIALSLDRQQLQVALADKDQARTLHALQQLLGSQVRVTALLATESHIEQALDKSYGHHLSIDGILQELEQERSHARSSNPPEEVRPAIRLVNALLMDAVKRGASDIHFEPEDSFLRIRYRIDGVLKQIRCLHGRYWPVLCVRLKIMAQLDIAEQRASQDGHVALFLCGRPIDFRVSSHPTLHGENIVLRILDREKAIRPLEAMALPATQLAQIQQWLQKPAGLLIMTGPTGSGKTTTLYAMLAALNHEQVNIMTLEDPVEYPHTLMRQTAIQAGNKVDFVNGLRAILRQDPDIILLGEVRDEATAAMAMRAAMTGHLVLTTLHTNSALAALGRLQDLGVTLPVITTCVIGVIAQRLLRRLCPHCKQSQLATPILRQWFQQYCGASDQAELRHWVAGDCHHCQHTGYQGRLVVMELLEMHPDLQAHLSGPWSVPSVQALARAQGMTSLAEEGLRRVYAGDTSLQELRRVIDLSPLRYTEGAQTWPTTIEP